MLFECESGMYRSGNLTVEHSESLLFQLSGTWINSEAAVQGLWVSTIFYQNYCMGQALYLYIVMILNPFEKEENNNNK